MNVSLSASSTEASLPTSLPSRIAQLDFAATTRICGRYFNRIIFALSNLIRNRRAAAQCASQNQQGEQLWLCSICLVASRPPPLSVASRHGNTKTRDGLPPLISKLSLATYWRHPSIKIRVCSAQEDSITQQLQSNISSIIFNP